MYYTSMRLDTSGLHQGYSLESRYFDQSLYLRTYLFFLQENNDQHTKTYGTQDEIVGYEFDTITTQKSLFQTYKALLYVRKFRT